jgi:hypothetical protein
VFSDRRCGSNDGWQFVWQAGFVLVFNDGDMPKFDNADAAFLNRMVVGPMRSKFVEAGSPALLGEQWTYPNDLALSEKFPSWLPAVADVLVDCYGGADEAFEALPEGMREWRRGVAAAGNPVADWCDAMLTVSDNASDFVFIGEMMAAYGGSLPKSRFTQLVAVRYAAVAGVRFNKRTTVTRADGTHNVVSGVLWGVKAVVPF